MSGIFDRMISAYDTSTPMAKKNAIYEVMQHRLIDMIKFQDPQP